MLCNAGCIPDDDDAEFPPAQQPCWWTVKAPYVYRWALACLHISSFCSLLPSHAPLATGFPERDAPKPLPLSPPKWSWLTVSRSVRLPSTCLSILSAVSSIRLPVSRSAELLPSIGGAIAADDSGRDDADVDVMGAKCSCGGNCNARKTWSVW